MVVKMSSQWRERKESIREKYKNGLTPSPSLRGNQREKASPPAPLQGERGVISLIVTILAHTHFAIKSGMNTLFISPLDPNSP